ncbi:MAG TPA: hypothetical protein VHA12_01965 [Candidatus Nanoarchaeia archaeon]|nr:hypothetical protein [Candidatus Nanoarchaeia archaeon]
MKALIFDAGPLINLSMNGLLYILEDLKKQFGGKFLITPAVKNEVIDRPLNVQKFELGAMEVQNLLNKGILEMSSSAGINNEELEKETNEIMDMANHFIEINNQWIKIVSAGEMSCLALSNELKRAGWETMIAIDERTTRLLGEDPKSLEQLMSQKLHSRAQIVAKDLRIFNQFRFIRSSELVYVAYKKGLIRLQGKKVLEAVLYATKFKGTAISFEEIETLKKL